MSRWADWFAITPIEAHRFTTAYAAGGEPMQELLAPWLERLEELPLHVQMDKAWEPIHRCLTGDNTPRGGLDFGAGDYPLKLCVLGGAQLLTEGYRTASLVQANQVPDVAAALAKVEMAWLRQRFFALPTDQFHEINDETFEWVWEHFQELPPFFARAAVQGCAVICTISH